MGGSETGWGCLVEHPMVLHFPFLIFVNHLTWTVNLPARLRLPWLIIVLESCTYLLLQHKRKCFIFFWCLNVMQNPVFPHFSWKTNAIFWRKDLTSDGAAMAVYFDGLWLWLVSIFRVLGFLPLELSQGWVGISMDFWFVYSFFRIVTFGFISSCLLTILWNQWAYISFIRARRWPRLISSQMDFSFFSSVEWCFFFFFFVP